ncbi:MAG: Lrp/AsnC family transcriptional regulator [Nanoarchaeota archaeon]|nr:Lrp/AsnC family transcriptional regulator [Nanoarchaeota archaeon]
MLLNTKDKKILKELDNNPKISTSRLAKKVRLSQQVVDYRIKQLQKKGIIKQFGTIINPSVIGYEQYRILFQLKNRSEEEREKLIQYLKNNKQVYWAASTGNKWDLIIVLLVWDYNNLEDFLGNIFKKFPNLMKDYESAYTLYHEFYKHDFLFTNNKTTPPIKTNVANRERKLSLDKTDKKIISLIKNNCRLSSLEISKHCKVNYKTIQNRIKRMEENNFIVGYRMFLKTQKYGYKGFLVFLSFDSYGRDIEKKILAFANSHKDITQATKLFGRWSLLLHLRTKDFSELQNTIIELRNKYPIIGDFEIIPVFKNLYIDLFPIAKT